MNPHPYQNYNQHQQLPSQDYSSEMNRGRSGYPNSNLQGAYGNPNIAMNPYANNQNFNQRMQNAPTQPNNDQGGSARIVPPPKRLFSKYNTLV